MPSVSSEANSPLRLLIVDDHEVVRAGLRMLLKRWPNIDVVGEAATAADGVEQSRTQEPDVVLMDMRLPDGSGVDACRENLRPSSRLDLPNVLFIIANARALPQEFYGLISHVAINFPWGSLLESLLTGDPVLMNGLAQISKPHTKIDIRLNGGALAEAGSCLEAGTQTIFDHMNRYGWITKHPYLMDNHALQKFSTTWAKRLAYGRDPRAMAIHGNLAK